MRSIWYSLAWKEWHEHKWKLASLLAILWATAALALYYGERDGLAMASLMVTFCVVPLGVFIGLSAAANERSRGTLAFSQALPTPIWRFALLKLIFGLAILLVAVAMTLPLFYFWNHCAELRVVESATIQQLNKETFTGNFYLDAFLLCASLAVSMYIWAAAAGVNRKDEISAGAVALAVMVGWYVILIVIGYMIYSVHEWLNGTPMADDDMSRFAVPAISTAPAGFAYATAVLRGHSSHLPVAAWYRDLLIISSTATITHLVLAGWYVRRFGRIANIEVHSPQAAIRNARRQDWLSAPHRSKFAAIVWKQKRESGPLVAAGVAGVFGITLFIFAANPRYFLQQRNELAAVTSIVSVTLGFAITLIVGIGVCWNDVGSQLNTFWRSRPINPDIWFWNKFATGLAVLVGALFVPLLIVVVLLHPDPSQLITATSAIELLLAQIALYAAAVAATSLVRQAVYAAILSIPLMYLGILLVWFAVKTAGVFGMIGNVPKGIMEMSHEQIASGFLLTFAISTVLGWLAVRYDWGRKSRD